MPRSSSNSNRPAAQNPNGAPTGGTAAPLVVAADTNAFFTFPLANVNQVYPNEQKGSIKRKTWGDVFTPSNWSITPHAITIPTPKMKGAAVLAFGDGKIVGWIGGSYNPYKIYPKSTINTDGTVPLDLGKGLILQLTTAGIVHNGKTYHYVFYGGLEGYGSNTVLNQTVSQGDTIGDIGNTDHSKLIIGILNLGDKDQNRFQNVDFQKNRSAIAGDPNILYDILSNADAQTGSLVPPQTTSGGSTSNPLDNPGSIATAAAFSSYFQMPGMMETQEAIALTGRRSLMNDQPLLPWIEQIAGASLRSFMSMPNGNFYAFYPDYFGGLGRTAYWVINDVEIISGKIDLSDDALATHVFVVGDTTPAEGGFGHVDFIDKINSAGVVNVYNAFMADFLNGPAEGTQSTTFDSTKPSLANKDAAINFLKKYGARPIVEEVPAIRSPIYETFLAYQRFCLLWAAQFKTTFEFTFMPELFPGGLVELEGHGIQCYVDQVVHSGSYESGFTTQATLSAPAATKNSTTGKPVDPDRSWVHSGMIRAFQFDPNTPPSHPAQAYDASTPRPAPKSTGNTE